MILYQYVSANVGMTILESNRVGFRKQQDFNDPLEGTLAPVQPGMNAELILQQIMEHCDEEDPHRDVEYAVRMSQPTMSAVSLGMNCVVLCLTKKPTNPLMWAHYSGLDGMVIGFDVDSEFFTGPNNICPIQFGDMIYSAEKPAPLVEAENVPPADAWFRQAFEEPNLGRVQSAFLRKADRWEYEDEVRIVKRLNDESETGIRERTVCSAGRELFLYDLPHNSIVEVYRYFHPMRFHALRNSPGVGGGEAPKRFRDHIVETLGHKFFAVTHSLDSWEFDVHEDP